MTQEQKNELLLKYAGMAMQGILSNTDMMHSITDSGKKIGMSMQKVLARNAIAYAVTLIEELYETAQPSPYKEENVDNKLLNRELVDFSLSVRVINVLCMNDIRTVRDLVRLHRTDFLRLRSTGKKTLSEIDDFMNDHHLQWGMDV